MPRDVLCVVLIIKLLPTQSVLSVISDTRALLEFQTLITNVALPISASSFDPDLVFYRKDLRFTEEEIDRDMEAVM